MTDKRRASLGRKVAYGFGSVAFGVKSNGFDYFFLIFYSQVMGVTAYLVSLALLVALIVDALSDPLIRSCDNILPKTPMKKQLHIFVMIGRFFI